jgi:SpoVK/Ycf46/Vps4 family AAA+-type ATPase
MQDIDEAILRRMPKKFPVTLPPAQQRLRILSLILKDTKVDRENFDLHYLVKSMAGMSGSDIKEACRDAAMAPVRELIRQKKADGLQITAVDPQEVRGLRTEDFFSRAGGVRVMPQPAQMPTTPTGKVIEKEDGDWTTEDEAASETDTRPSEMAEPPE